MKTELFCILFILVCTVLFTGCETSSPQNECYYNCANSHSCNIYDNSNPGDSCDIAKKECFNTCYHTNVTENGNI